MTKALHVSRPDRPDRPDRPRRSDRPAVRDHGIDADLIDRVYRTAREFFALPEAVKMHYHQPGTGGARGYTGFGI
ncbi:MAG: hypothetical protein EA388_15515, partial [Nitriliruptor sp.]